MTELTRHVCGISGGKDSSALAIYMRDRVPDMEYFFCDTGAELPETYEYLNKLEAVLGKPIARLNSDKGFDHWFEVFRGALPSPQMRWCTKYMKIQPLEAWLGDAPAISYVGIRADENNRKGYISTKPNIETSFPFVDDGIDHTAVLKILDDAGVGLPSYYEWRTRSGCYFCFYQRKAEWVGLADRHPELFERAVAIENKVLIDAEAGEDANYVDHAMQTRDYTWSSGESLTELLERRDEILERHQQAMEREQGKRQNIPLVEALAGALDADDDGDACTVCSI